MCTYVYIYIRVLSFALRRVLVSWSCMNRKQATRRVSFRSLPVYVSLSLPLILSLSLFICTGSNRQTDGLGLINCGASLPASLFLSHYHFATKSHSLSLSLSLSVSFSLPPVPKIRTHTARGIGWTRTQNRTRCGNEIPPRAEVATRKHQAQIKCNTPSPLPSFTPLFNINCNNLLYFKFFISINAIQNISLMQWLWKRLLCCALRIRNKFEFR